MSLIVFGLTCQTENYCSKHNNVLVYSLKGSDEYKNNLSSICINLSNIFSNNYKIKNHNIIHFNFYDLIILNIDNIYYNCVILQMNGF